MSPISGTWPNVALSLEALPPEFADRVTSLVSWLTPHFSHIEAYATSLHPTKRKCKLIRENYTWGQSFIVFELIFPPDGEEVEESWMIRFGMRPMDAYFNTAAQLERKILNEVAALHLVRSRTTIPVPHVIAYHPVCGTGNSTEADIPTNNHGPHPLGPDFPAFVLMTAIRGITIEDCGIAVHELGLADPDADPLHGDETKRPILKRYLRDLADIHVQLSRITFDKIGGFVLDRDGNVSVGPGADFGLGPFESAKEYFAIQAEAYERLAEATSEAEAEEQDGLVQDEEESAELLKRRFVASLWRTAMMPLVDERDAGGPFPMRHGDLHSENILVDETGHIVGVLDWDCASTVPWEAFAVPTYEVSGHFQEPQEPRTPAANVIADELEHLNISSGPVPTLPLDLESGRKHRLARMRSRPQVHSEFNKALAEIEGQNLHSRSSSISSIASSACTSSSVSAFSTEPGTPTDSSFPLTLHHPDSCLYSDSQPPSVSSPLQVSHQGPLSGRSLAALHDSDAGYVGAYLAYWMYSLACDYEETGRALYRMVVARARNQNRKQARMIMPQGENGGVVEEEKEWIAEGDMEEAFRKFVRKMKGESTAATVTAESEVVA